MLVFVAACSDSPQGKPLDDAAQPNDATDTPSTSQDTSSFQDAAPDLLRSDSGSSNVFEIEGPTSLDVDEEQQLSATFNVQSDGAHPVRLFATDLPPGARWNGATRALTFTPDFTQGGQTWTTILTADNGESRQEKRVTIEVHDTISPPLPRITAIDDMPGWNRLHISQTTDTWLDSPGYAGRTFDAIITVPDVATPDDPKPVRVVLHGFIGRPWDEGWEGEFRIAPHDPMNSYWWGYSETLPANSEPAEGTVPNYTARRVMHLLGWLLNTYPGADRHRVYADGASMGGAGAATIGLMHARHFAWVSATIGQKIPRNHRPSRIAQLQTLWGSPTQNLPADPNGIGAWDHMDITRLLRDSPEARAQFLFTKHGKDDLLIHFGAVVHPSPLTQRSFYNALQHHRVGHFAVWDEGGHGLNDPVLGDAWWHVGWNPIFDTTTSLRRNQAFPAFSNSQIDDDPGDGQGNGRQPWSDASGYAGNFTTPEDTGWNGDVAGALNRHLRWDSSRLLDSFERFELPLTAIDGPGDPPARPGYPTTGDKLPSAPPIRVDVTLRRVRMFQTLPGELVMWRFGDLSGTQTVDEFGVITIPQLPLTTAWQTLTVERSPR